MNIKIYEYLKQHPKMDYLQKCIRRIRDSRWVQSVLDIDEDPMLFRFESRGEEYKDKIIYHIKIKNRTKSGFFALLSSVINAMYGADRMGFIPYVEYDENTCYSEKELINGTQNAYEYYFKQYDQIEHDKIENAACVAIYEPRNSKVWDKEIAGYAQKEEQIEALGKIYKKYITLNSETEKYIQEGIKRKISSGTLGIHVRATDFITKHDVNHPVAVGYECHMEIAEKLLQTGRFNKIFLATDDAGIITEFKKKFGDNVVYYEDTFRSENGQSIHQGNVDNQREHHKYLNGLEVLRDVYTLAYCDGLVAGLSMVSFFARIINNSLDKRYEEVEIINKGINKSGKRAR